MRYDAYHNPDDPRRIEDVAYKALSNGLTNEETLGVVKQEFPRSHTTLHSIRWYRSRLRKINPTVPTSLGARKARKAP